MLMLNLNNLNFFTCFNLDSEEDQKDDQGNLGGRISSAAFLMIMEDGIRTFSYFLKADRENPCQIIMSLFKRKRRCSVDPTLLNLMKKVNQKVSQY